MEASGNYVLSKYKSSGIRAFGSDKRRLFADKVSKNQVVPLVYYINIYIYIYYKKNLKKKLWIKKIH